MVLVSFRKFFFIVLLAQILALLAHQEVVSSTVQTSSRSQILLCDVCHTSSDAQGVVEPYPGVVLTIQSVEVAATNLATLVKTSDLDNSDLIARFLQKFASQASQTSRLLRRLSSRISAAMVSVTSIPSHPSNSKQEEYRTGKTMTNLPIHYSQELQMVTNVESVVPEMFVDLVVIAEMQLTHIILEVDISLQALRVLEESLHVLQNLGAREYDMLSKAATNLHGELWTTLGGNKNILKRMGASILLLEELRSCHDRVKLLLSDRVQTLLALNVEIEDLRARLAAALLLGTRIPSGDHMRNIQDGLRRVQDLWPSRDVLGG